MRRAASIAAFLVISLGVAIPAPASAHAFGSFSISVYGRLTVYEEHIDIRWVLDMAEIPAAATVELIDTDADGEVTDQEKAEYFDIWVGSVLDHIQLVVDGTDISKRIVNRELTLPLGEGGNPALRLVMDLSSDIPAGGPAAGRRHTASYNDTNYDDYIGWREVAVAPGPGMQLLESSAPLEGRTNELTVYPPDLGMSVPTSAAEFVFAREAGGASGVPSLADGGSTPLSADPGFQVWPTGVLAVLLIVGLAGLMVAVNRPRQRQRRL